jgi:hypothetical protein
MSYYPLSQITTNLNTNGSEFVYASTNQEYKGNYWKNSKDEYFTGKTPQDTPVEKLIKIVYNEDNFLSSGKNATSTIALFPKDPDPVMLNYGEGRSISEYLILKKVNQTKIIYIPSYFATLPTQQDYQNTEFRRYFCKKANEIIYLEISKETYDKLVSQDSQIEYSLYIPFYLPWQLTGEREQVYKTNKNITELTSVRQKLPMLAEYLKMDFTKYYK